MAHPRSEIWLDVLDMSDERTDYQLLADAAQQIQDRPNAVIDVVVYDPYTNQSRTVQLDVDLVGQNVIIANTGEHRVAELPDGTAGLHDAAGEPAQMPEFVAQYELTRPHR